LRQIGSFLKPLVGIPRKTYETDLAQTGITDEKVDVYSQAKGHTDHPIFLAWLTHVFLSEEVRRCKTMGYQGDAVLIMDNCTAHTGPEVDGAWTSHGVVVCLLPRHSSNQLQPLDPSTFGIFNRHIARINQLETVNVQSGHTAHVASSFMSAASSLNVVGTLLNAGIALTLIEKGSYVVAFAQAKRDAE
jgi:hypothetical protein